MDSRQQIVAWLRDAHAMEQSIENVLQAQIADAKEMPELRARLEQHVTETRRHRDEVEAALAELNETPSTMKSMAGGFMGMAQGASMAMFRDELLKGVIGNYAMEHFEIACYRALRVAANEAGLSDLARRCEDILTEETEMAEWLEEQIPDMVRLHLRSLAVA